MHAHESCMSESTRKYLIDPQIQAVVGPIVPDEVQPFENGRRAPTHHRLAPLTVRPTELLWCILITRDDQNGEPYDAAVRRCLADIGSSLVRVSGTLLDGKTVGRVFVELAQEPDLKDGEHLILA